MSAEQYCNLTQTSSPVEMPELFVHPVIEQTWRCLDENISPRDFDLLQRELASSCGGETSLSGRSPVASGFGSMGNAKRKRRAVGAEHSAHLIWNP